MAHREAVEERGKKRREVRGVDILNAHAVDHLSHLWRFFRTSGIRKGESGFRTSGTIRRSDHAKHPPGPDTPCQYAIQVIGHLDAHWSEWLEGMTITHEEGDTTLLEGALSDQSALLGVLCKLGNMHLSILSVQHWDSPGA